MIQAHTDKVKIQRGYIPGTIGRIAELHGIYYHRHWGFGAFFEAKVARELAEFIGRYDDQRDGLWTARLGEHIDGSIAIDGIHSGEEGAHLRWFIVSTFLHGKGIGSRLINTAMRFCRSRGYKRVYLMTFEGLDQAKHLYEKSGFILTEQQRGSMWGTEVNEQRFELTLA
jgi:GNAT superfamily N-acetyltransferase